jgi:hypothetical protein
VWDDVHSIYCDRFTCRFVGENPVVRPESQCFHGVSFARPSLFGLLWMSHTFNPHPYPRDHYTCTVCGTVALACADVTRSLCGSSPLYYRPAMVLVPRTCLHWRPFDLSAALLVDILRLRHAVQSGAIRIPSRHISTRPTSRGSAPMSPTSSSTPMLDRNRKVRLCMYSMAR